VRRLWDSVPPLVRGLALVALVAVVVVVLSLEPVLATVGGLVRIAFFLAIAFFIYLVWRERRGDISSWEPRERLVFYGAALLIVAAIASYFWQGLPGYDALGFIGVIAGSVYAMFRVWRDRHTYL
jgi:F0F1-type ATP synthase assembly protein I